MSPVGKDPKIGKDLLLPLMYFRQGDFHPGCGPLYELFYVGMGKWRCTENSDEDNATTYTSDEIQFYVQRGVWRIV